jgi:GT2 family glycosyltransferase
LTENYVDCFGGPDAAEFSFSAVQKAISYSMTSFYTTGGIRGATKNSEKFSPRSFNMGLSKEVFLKTGGFKNMIAEDIDLSIRIKEAGFTTALLKNAFVYHKRRVSFRKFFRQVNTFGKGRVALNKLHKGSLKFVHLLPAAFVSGNIFLILLSLVFRNLCFLAPLAFYVLLLFVDSLLKNKNPKIAALSVMAAYTQLFGYGLGMFHEIITGATARKTQEELYR